MLFVVRLPPQPHPPHCVVSSLLHSRGLSVISFPLFLPWACAFGAYRFGALSFLLALYFLSSLARSRKFFLSPHTNTTEVLCFALGAVLTIYTVITVLHDIGTHSIKLGDLQGI